MSMIFKPRAGKRLSWSMISLLVFSFYVLALALSLLCIPNTILPLLGIPTTTEIWVRCAGMLLLGLWFYYICVIWAGMQEFLKFTVIVRSMVILFFGTFVALGWALPVFLIFGVIDLTGAIWTALALLSEHRRASGRTAG